MGVAKNFCFIAPCDGSYVERAEYSPNYDVGMKSFGLSCEDAQNKNFWRMRISRGNRLTQVNLENGRYNNVCMYVCVLFHRCVTAAVSQPHIVDIPP